MVFVPFSHDGFVFACLYEMKGLFSSECKYIFYVHHFGYFCYICSMFLFKSFGNWRLSRGHNTLVVDNY